MKKLVLIMIAVLGFSFAANAQYTPINIVESSYSNSRTTNYNSNEVVVGNINATVGIGGHWTFKFYSNGTFNSHVWYGNQGKYSTEGSMRNEAYRNGTYTIKEDEDGHKFVYLRFDNGAQEKAKLIYKGERVELDTPQSGKKHKEMY